VTDDLLTRIRDTADTLTEPHIHREPYTVWTGQRHRQTRHHITPQHGLLRQLYNAVLPATIAENDGGGTIPASRPPLELEALSRFEQITATTRNWCTQAGIRPRGNTESTIRALVAAAPNLDEPQQRDLHADLRRWTSWCRVYLGYEHIHTARGARCPLSDCHTLGVLRVNLTTSHALCVACGATWQPDTIGVLAEHIRASRQGAAA
jgi:hypothetical protein